MIKINLLEICNNKIIKYIFFGGMTTLVNLLSYYLFRILTNLSINLVNIISIVIAILFAYLVNSKYVFKSKCKTRIDRLNEFVKFVSARISTMVIEVVGVFTLIKLLQLNDFISKVIIQFVVLILNYFISKLIVFKHKT